MTNFIIDAASESIPVSRKRRKEKIPVPWFNAQCREAKIKRRAERALQCNHNVENLLAYKIIEDYVQNAGKRIMKLRKNPGQTMSPQLMLIQPQRKCGKKSTK